MLTQNPKRRNDRDEEFDTVVSHRCTASPRSDASPMNPLLMILMLPSLGQIPTALDFNGPPPFSAYYPPPGTSDDYERKIP